MIDQGPAAQLPRREQNKLDKLTRILAATREMLDTDGYGTLTIRAIAAKSDVAVGTVFRYAATKSELLLMVLGPEHQSALQQGLTLARARPTALSAALAFVEPALKWGHSRGAATLAYQREVLFGDPSERYRPDALETTLRSESELATIFALHHVPDAERTSRLLLNSLHIELSRCLLTGGDLPSLLVTAHDQLSLVLGDHAEAPRTTVERDCNV